MATRKPSATKKMSAGLKPITVFSYGVPDGGAGLKKREGDFTPQETLAFGGLGRLIERRAEISPDKLKKNLESFIDSMGSAMGGIPAVLAGYKLEEIELALEVGAEGEIGLLGTGGKLSGKGSITLKLKKP